MKVLGERVLTDADKFGLGDITLTPDKYFKSWVEAFAQGEISEEKYEEGEEYYLKNNPNRADIENLRRRIDGRTVFAFSEELKKHTLKETFLVNLFVAEMKILGHTVEIKNFGVDNSGGFIGKATKSQSKADFLVQIDRKGFIPAEVKNSPSSKKATFKKVNLEAYLEQDALMVLFYGTGRLENNFEAIDLEKTRWALLSSSDIRRILEELPLKKYWEIGNKLGVQLTDGQFDRYFVSRKLQSIT